MAEKQQGGEGNAAKAGCFTVFGLVTCAFLLAFIILALIGGVKALGFLAFLLMFVLPAPWLFSAMAWLADEPKKHRRRLLIGNCVTVGLLAVAWVLAYLFSGSSRW